MEDLPPDLTIDILSKLPVKTVVHCKRVCNKWRNLIFDSSFINLYISRSPNGLIVHRNVECSISYCPIDDPGILKWVEIEDEVDHHHLRHVPPMSLHLNMVPIFKHSIISQMGSVNGLICLRQYCFKPGVDDTYICNPVTREIMTLRGQQYCKPSFATTIYGFGVGSLTGEYKVVRIFQDMPLNGYKSSRLSVLEAKVYTLGTCRWRSLGEAPYRFNESKFSSCGTFLNDHCHWILSDNEDAPEKIFTFDLNKETFQLFPSPPSEAMEESYNHFQSLAVLKGCLCKSDAYGSQFSLWMMKEYGIKKSWHKEMVITNAISRGVEWPFLEPMSLKEVLKDGSILLVSRGKLWVFYPRSETIEDIDMRGSCESVLSYRPSFLKLQNFQLEKVHMF